MIRETEACMSDRLFQGTVAGFGVLVTIMLGGLGAMLTLQMFTMSQVNDMDGRLTAQINDMDRRLTRIETVMVIQNMMPQDLLAHRINEYVEKIDETVHET